MRRDSTFSAPRFFSNCHIGPGHGGRQVDVDGEQAVAHHGDRAGAGRDGLAVGASTAVLVVMKAFVRSAGEVVLALALGLFAAETWTHRAFSPDPRYKAIIGWFAFLIASLGILPLLLHFLPRTGKVGSLVWMALLVVLAVIGFLTRP